MCFYFKVIIAIKHKFWGIAKSKTSTFFNFFFAVYLLALVKLS